LDTAIFWPILHLQRDYSWDFGGTFGSAGYVGHDRHKRVEIAQLELSMPIPHPAAAQILELSESLLRCGQLFAIVCGRRCRLCLIDGYKGGGCRGRV